LQLFDILDIVVFEEAIEDRVTRDTDAFFLLLLLLTDFFLGLL